MFLEKAENFPAEHVAELRFNFTEFLECCRSALDVNRKLVEPSMLAFHEQMESDYQKLQDRILPALVGDLTARPEGEFL